MASVLSRRLGKRSLLGARISAPPLLGDGMLMTTQVHPLQLEHTRASSHQNTLSYEEGRFKEHVEASGSQNQHWLLLQPGQKDRLLSKWKIPTGSDGHQAQPFWKIQLGEGYLRKPDAAVEMDEMMAAMVLTSLSCSPVVQSPPNNDASISASQATCDAWKESGDMSDGGSSTTSGHWSGISTPSPPHSEASPKYSNEAFSSPRADDGFETDSDPFVFEEPAPRKRKNSVKVMYKCLWPNCGKVLRSIVGIKRHVKTQHLGDGANSDQRKREEDFYYTEMQVKEEALPESSVVAPNPTAGSSPIVIQQAASQPEALILDQATPLEPHLASSALSQSAPSSFWHIQADHAYQALPSIQIPVSPHIFTSISWAAATSTIPTLSPVRSRSLSFSEQPPPPPVLKSQLIVASPPRAPSGTRKVRGEAKKCRKVYGIEHRDQWCTACRWKKACQRFLD
ncbi:zinc finger protein 395 [Notechis scutatus]|uniref:Zinc finger protein 395 n=1 Tax=Notechis scutatus TaxID=8663 RepID=A0A6J1UA32_9SAUR|nr:zinc finger protein 395 [Notechis scutatus]